MGGYSVLKRAILYIHGKGGSYKQAQQYKKNCPGFDIIGVDYNDYLPWIVQNQIREAFDKLREEYEQISIIADSIGAYFAMLSLQKNKIEKALFISPVLDMERLILDMMKWANVTERELLEKGEIPTDFGETLSWRYLCFVRQNPIQWDVPTRILFAGNDNLTSRSTVETFVKNHRAELTVMENGEHWFHTEEQIAFLDEWMKKAI
ncbi:MAG: alpha/beta hydrolase [Clostridia bacterium]|nr:alpha/beta hydrolase [Clostridia bacterium]